MFQSDVRPKRAIVPSTKVSENPIEAYSSDEEDGSGDDFVLDKQGDSEKRLLSPVEIVSPNKGAKKKAKEPVAKKSLFPKNLSASTTTDSACDPPIEDAVQLVAKVVRRKK